MPQGHPKLHGFAVSLHRVEWDPRAVSGDPTRRAMNVPEWPQVSKLQSNLLTRGVPEADRSRDVDRLALHLFHSLSARANASRRVGLHATWRHFEQVLAPN